MDAVDPTTPTQSPAPGALALLRAAQNEFDASVQRLVAQRNALRAANLRDEAPDLTALREAAAAYRRAADALRVARERWRADVLTRAGGAAHGAGDAAAAAPGDCATPLPPPRWHFARWLVATGRVTDWPAAG